MAKASPQHQGQPQGGGHQQQQGLSQGQPGQAGQQSREAVPDTAESYERAQPAAEPGMGDMGTPRRGRDDRDDHAADSKRNRKNQPAFAGQDQRSAADVVHPDDPAAHAGREDAAAQKGSNE